MIYQVTKEFGFCAAHRLLNHRGKCARFHGHNYVAEVTLETDRLDPATNMVVDFDRLKETVGEWIKVFLDHNAILNSADSETIRVLQSLGQEPFLTADDPTAEEIARVIFAQTERMLANVPIPVRVRSGVESGGPR
jgi:6-pyruvoyltetrahydropterin/6-carboxytetrahydropterin synthase